jgi:hypothetical protein
MELHVDGGITDLVPLGGALGFAPTDVWVLDVAAPAGTGSWRARGVVSVLGAALTASMRARPLVSLDGVAVHHLALRGEVTGTSPGRLMDFGHSAELIEMGRATAQTAVEASRITT